MRMLSQYFSLEEFTRSQTAARHGIDMRVPANVLANLTHLARDVLDPIRRRLGVPIIVTSGYRPPKLNTLVGGSGSSDHMVGLAADIVCNSLGLRTFADLVREQAELLPVEQVIVEFGQWVHVSATLLGAFPRRQYLVAELIDGKTAYSAWPV
jgi:zinc D-Ala-D-Ala carboxypeptidase